LTLCKTSKELLYAEYYVNIIELEVADILLLKFCATVQEIAIWKRCMQLSLICISIVGSVVRHWSFSRILAVFLWKKFIRYNLIYLYDFPRDYYYYQEFSPVSVAS